MEISSGRIIQSDISEVFVEKDLKPSLYRLNTDICFQPDREDEVIHKLRVVAG